MTIYEVGAVIVVAMIMFVYGIIAGAFIVGAIYENKSDNKIQKWHKKGSK